MFFSKTFSKFVPAIAVFAVLSASPGSAFGRNQSVKATSSFQQATSSATDALRIFYQGVNQSEREFYFHKLRFDPTIKMESEEANGNATGLVTRYTEDQIQVRVLVLALLSNYTEKLSQLAAAPDSTVDNGTAQNLGVSFSNICAALSSLGMTVPGAAIFTGPLASLSGMTVSWWTGKKREVVLKQTVSSNAIAVRSLFKLLRTDVEQVWKQKYRARTTKELDDYIAEYNSKFVSKLGNSETFDPSKNIERQLFLTRAAEAASRKIEADNASPLLLIDKMSQLHEDLVAYAGSDKVSPATIEKILADLDSYSMEAKTVLDYVWQLRGRR